MAPLKVIAFDKSNWLMRKSILFDQIRLQNSPTNRLTGSPWIQKLKFLLQFSRHTEACARR